MNLWHEYRLPTSIQEALQDLLTAPPPAVPIAGGTDLLLDIKQGRHPPVHTLVDLTNVAEMIQVEMRGKELFIGAAVPVNHIAHHPLVTQHAQALIESCSLIAGPQVRNTATLGGNVAHALPAAEGSIALVALDAWAEIASASGLRRLACLDLFVGPGKSVLNKSEEILVGFYIPKIRPTQSSCFNRIMRPQGVALPILNCAVWLEREQEILSDIRIAIGPGGPIPFRAVASEAFLRGKIYNEGNYSSMLEVLLQETKFRTSPRRASAEYRQMIAGDLLKRTLDIAWKRAAQTDG